MDYRVLKGETINGVRYDRGATFPEDLLTPRRLALLTQQRRILPAGEARPAPVPGPEAVKAPRR